MTEIPGPPRLTGDPQLDFAAYVQWLGEFYRIGVLEDELLQASQQLSTADLVEVGDLPDPSSTTLAQAQQTANDALILAATNDARLDIIEAQITVILANAIALAARVTVNEGDITDIETAAGVLAGRVTTNETDIGNLETAVTAIETRLDDIEFGQFTISGTDTTATPTVAQPDTAYRVVALPTAQTGTPAAGSGDVITVVNGTIIFTATIAVAPGAGNSVTFDYIVMR